MDLFVYGTLMDSNNLLDLLGYKPKSIVAKLYGFTKYNVINEYYPAIIQSNNKNVINGLILKNLSDTDLIILDNYEGNEYKRELVLINKKYIYCYIWNQDYNKLIKIG